MPTDITWLYHQGQADGKTVHEVIAERFGDVALPLDSEDQKWTDILATRKEADAHADWDLMADSAEALGRDTPPPPTGFRAVSDSRLAPVEREVELWQRGGPRSKVQKIIMELPETPNPKRRTYEEALAASQPRIPFLTKLFVRRKSTSSSDQGSSTHSSVSDGATVGNYHTMQYPTKKTGTFDVGTGSIAKKIMAKLRDRMDRKKPRSVEESWKGRFHATDAPDSAYNDYLTTMGLDPAQAAARVPSLDQRA